MGNSILRLQKDDPSHLQPGYGLTSCLNRQLGGGGARSIAANGVNGKLRMPLLKIRELRNRQAKSPRSFIAISIGIPSRRIFLALDPPSTLARREKRVRQRDTANIFRSSSTGRNIKHNRFVTSFHASNRDLNRDAHSLVGISLLGFAWSAGSLFPSTAVIPIGLQVNGVVAQAVHPTPKATSLLGLCLVSATPELGNVWSVRAPSRPFL